MTTILTPARFVPGSAPAYLRPWLTRDRTPLMLRDSGATCSAQTPTVVMLHGWTLDHTSWDDVTDLLAHSGGLRTISYDQRGHGRSAAAPHGTATIAQLAGDLSDILTHVAPGGPVILVGHSLGGMTIMEFAARHPEQFAGRVRGAVLVATSCNGLGEDIFGLPPAVTKRLRAVQTQIVRRQIKRGLPERDFTSTRPELTAPGLRFGLFGRGSSSRDRLRTAQQSARSHPATTAALGIGISEFDRRTTLHTFGQIQVAVLAGEIDRLLPLAHSRRISSHIPGSELVSYPSAGHMLPYERPREVADQIVRMARNIPEETP